MPVGAKRHADHRTDVAGHGARRRVDRCRHSTAAPCRRQRRRPAGARRGETSRSSPSRVAGDDFEGVGTLDHRTVQRAVRQGWCWATHAPRPAAGTPARPRRAGCRPACSAPVPSASGGRRLHHLMSGGHRLLFCSGGPAERDHRNDRTDKGDHGDDRVAATTARRIRERFGTRQHVSRRFLVFRARIAVRLAGVASRPLDGRLHADGTPGRSRGRIQSIAETWLGA